MLANIFTKTLYDQRRSLLAWSVSLVLLVGMYVAIWPSMRDQPNMNDFLDQMPEAFRSLFATSGADMSTPVGYIQIELLSFMAPIAALIYAISGGAAAISGEEDRHTMDLLLANPVSRDRVLLDKFAAMALGTFLLAGVIGLALVAEGSLVDMGLPAGNVAAVMLHLALLGGGLRRVGAGTLGLDGEAGPEQGDPDGGRRGRLLRERPGSTGRLARTFAEALTVLPIHRPRPVARRRFRRKRSHCRGDCGCARRHRSSRLPQARRRGLIPPVGGAGRGWISTRTSVVIEQHWNGQDFPSCPGERRIGRGSQSHAAIVCSAVEHAGTFNRAQALQKDNVGIVVVGGHYLPPGPGEGRFGVGGQPDIAVMRVAVEPARPVNVPQTLERYDAFAGAKDPPLCPGERRFPFRCQADRAVVCSAIQEAGTRLVAQATQRDVVSVFKSHRSLLCL